MSPALRRFPVETIGERRCRGLQRFAPGELARIGSSRMIRRNQDPQIPRRGVWVCLAEHLDHPLRIHAEAFFGARPQSGLVERERLWRGPIVERLLGPRISDEQWNVGGEGRTPWIPRMVRYDRA